MHTAGVVVLVIFLALIAAGIGWIVWTRSRAARLGLPPPPLLSYIPFLGRSSASYSGPAPAPGGIKGWFADLSRKFQQKRNPNTRTAAGAYEGNSDYYNSSYNGGYSNNRAGRSPLDDDEHAWDARVGEGYNPYEEERELGLHPPSQPSPGYYLSQAQGAQIPQGDGYAMNVPLDDNEADERRGRTRSRSPGPTGAAGGAGLKVQPNPFGDEAESSNISLRGVSPRPVVDTNVGGRGKKPHVEDNSPTERKSIFRENV
ncbi:hypothetical protein QBC35DRAFT_200576 [Podospora australis]|uniref:Acid phosphatase-like protein n=1 Tax=Podospora australis TaxID=1536484 RepID=A0AAN6X2C0_9PEZI|nr:hypothetical protein QBC35DRAFT_200576 [Podospora australis]